MNIAADHLAKLRHDGDTAELENTSTLRLRIEGTDIPAMDLINEFDCYGTVAWVTGAARKLHPNGWHMDSPVWWQPHETAIKMGPDAIDQEALQMTQLLADGFYTVTLELLDGEDAYHRPIVAAVASCGGIDTVDPSKYLPTMISELADELAR